MRNWFCMSVRQLVCMLLAAFVLPGYAVKMYPGDDKRKAFPLPFGSGSASLPLTAEEPWRIGNSSIIDRDGETLWKRRAADFYELSNAFAP